MKPAVYLGVCVLLLAGCGESRAPETPQPLTEAPAPTAQPAADAVTDAPVPLTDPETTATIASLPAPIAPQPASAVAPAPAAPVAAPAEAAPAKPDLAHGQQVYQQSCAFCHDKGIAGAPKIADRTAWGTRLALGQEALLNSALRGKGAMPAKGGNPALADADVRAAVDFIVTQSR